MIALALALAAACQAGEAVPSASVRDDGQPCAGPRAANWRTIATPDDRTRLRTWRDSWTAAIDQARARDAAAIAAQGALFDPDRAQPGPMPPPGDYRCRTFKLGALGSGGLPFVAYPAFTCQVSPAGAMLRLAKLSGSQRPVGTLYRDGTARGVFLGTLVLGDERTPLKYGQDRQRDIAGYVERIGDARWRLVLPAPAFESLTDVIELVPAG